MSSLALPHISSYTDGRCSFHYTTSSWFQHSNKKRHSSHSEVHRCWAVRFSSTFNESKSWSWWSRHNTIDTNSQGQRLWADAYVVSTSVALSTQTHVPITTRVRPIQNPLCHHMLPLLLLCFGKLSLMSCCMKERHRMWYLNSKFQVLYRKTLWRPWTPLFFNHSASYSEKLDGHERNDFTVPKLILQVLLL